MLPLPAYLKILRAISEHAVTIRVTSVELNPARCETSLAIRRTWTMSASSLIASSDAASLVMGVIFAGISGEAVEGSINIQRGFHFSEIKSNLGGGHGHSRTHSGDDCSAAHQVYHLCGLRDGPGEK